MSIRIFKSALIRQQLSQQELDALAGDFLSYKKDGVLPDIFGRDAPYDNDRTSAPFPTAPGSAEINVKPVYCGFWPVFYLLLLTGLISSLLSVSYRKPSF